MDWKSISLIKRLEMKSIPIPECGCHIWTGYTTNKGYGRLYVNNKKESAHRATWIAHHGKIPKGKWVLHHCDTRSCVNIHHLFLGTPRDNVQDAIKKGRVPQCLNLWKTKKHLACCEHIIGR